MPKLQLIGRKQMTERVSQYSFDSSLEHRPGQHVALQADVAGSTLTRYYSIASPPRPDGRIELCIRDDGTFGAFLRGLAAGDGVECSEPAGRMCLLDPALPAVYFAAGTGVAPMRAILRSHLTADPGADAVLVLGARRPEELLYGEEFEALAGKHPRFRYLPTVSRAGASWQGRQGRVTDHFAEAVGGRKGLAAYFCGQPEMVARLRTLLASAGIGDERQSYERY